MTQQNQQNNKPEDRKDDIYPNKKNTPIVAETRKTGQGALESDVREGAEAEAPGNKNTGVPGDPNQGTEAR
jgi:photosystem I subunit 4